MAFLLPAFTTLRNACKVIPFLCAIYLIVTMFYIFNSDNGLSIFRILPQNTTRNQSKMFRQMVKNMTIELPKCPETSPLLGKLYE